MAGPGGGRRGSRSSSRSSTRSTHSSSYGHSMYRDNHKHHHIQNGFPMYIIGLIITVFIILIVGLTEHTAHPGTTKELHEYADSQYDALFGSSKHAENNVLFIYVVDEEGKWLDTVIWTGTEVPIELILEITKLGITQRLRPVDYVDTLSSDIAKSINNLTTEIEPMNISSHTTCMVKNLSNLDVDVAIIKKSLTRFASVHGYGITVLIDDFDNVYGKPPSPTPIVCIVSIVGWCTFFVIRYARKSKKNKCEKEHTQ